MKMDLEEWEILPDDGFLEIHDDGGKKIFSRKYGKIHQNSIFQTNYFICPSSPNSQKFVQPTENSIVPKQIVHVPIQLDHDQVVKQRTKVPIEIKIAQSRSSSSVLITEKIEEDPNILIAVEANQDAASQVFFKKMKENEFVDMKMDSPKSGSRGTMVPQIDSTTFKFDDKSEAAESKKNNLDSDIKEEETANWEENSGGLNLWKWSLNGVGAICSFGVAAATICIIILGTSQRNKQNQKLRFQIYTDDKRIKQMEHHATKLNEAISAARGVSLTRAHITFGGYYDGL